jgi:hypothetical protein
MNPQVGEAPESKPGLCADEEEESLRNALAERVNCIEKRMKKAAQRGALERQ